MPNRWRKVYNMKCICVRGLPVKDALFVVHGGGAALLPDNPACLVNSDPEVASILNREPALTEFGVGIWLPGALVCGIDPGTS